MYLQWKISSQSIITDRETEMETKRSQFIAQEKQNVPAYLALGWGTFQTNGKFYKRWGMFLLDIEEIWFFV